jgi:hypothetical protein
VGGEADVEDEKMECRGKPTLVASSLLLLGNLPVAASQKHRVIFWGGEHFTPICLMLPWHWTLFITLFLKNLSPWA